VSEFRFADKKKKEKERELRRQTLLKLHHFPGNMNHKSNPNQVQFFLMA
jgi:hypothetical protein